jgi:hypothetical protein
MTTAGAEEHDADAARAKPSALSLPLTAIPEPTAPRSPAALGGAAFFATLALAMVLVPVAVFARAAGALALVATAAMFVRRASHHALASRARARGWIVTDDRGVSRIEASFASARGRARALVRWSEPFGVTVLTAVPAAHAGRGTRAIVAFTTPTETRYVAVTIADADDAAASMALLGRAVVVTDAELSSVLGDGGVALSGKDAARLLGVVTRRAPGALDRLYLSGARSEPIVLDRGTLRIGKHVLDLAAPLEWRGFMFHESAGIVAAFYQATWVRQLDAEAVLVAPMPAEASQARDARELRVVQSLPGEPPARELRVAIERLFMLPLRHALDRAPRISLLPPPATLPTRPSRPEGLVP